VRRVANCEGTNMNCESPPKPEPSWGSLLCHSSEKKVLLRRGSLLGLMLLPLAVFLVWATASGPEDLSPYIWLLCALLVDFFLCILLAFALWSTAILMFAGDRRSKAPYALMEWGLAAFWWWLIPIFIFGLWQSS